MGYRSSTDYFGGMMDNGLNVYGGAMFAPLVDKMLGNAAFLTVKAVHDSLDSINFVSNNIVFVQLLAELASTQAATITALTARVAVLEGRSTPPIITPMTSPDVPNIPTTLPSQPGQLWIDNGALSIS